MRKAERIVLMTSVAVSIGIGIGWRSTSASAEAGAVEPQAVRIASVDVFAVAEKLIVGEGATALRDAEQKKWSDQLDPIMTELNEMKLRFEVLPQGDPQAQQLVAAAQAKGNEYQMLQQQANVDFDRFKAVQLLEMFEQAMAAADVVADRLGYTHVFATRARDVAAEPGGLNAAIQVMLARPMIKAPAEDDLTELVMGELGLDASPADEPTDQPTAEPEG